MERYYHFYGSHIVHVFTEIKVASLTIYVSIWIKSQLKEQKRKEPSKYMLTVDF